MKQFISTQYPSREYMLEAKAAYWEAVAMRCIAELELEFGQVLRQDNQGYYWDVSGESLDEGL